MPAPVATISNLKSLANRYEKGEHLSALCLEAQPYPVDYRTLQAAFKRINSRPGKKGSK